MPNHAKKHKKKAIHDMWNARICGVANVSKEMRVAFSLASMADGELHCKCVLLGMSATVRRIAFPPHPSQASCHVWQRRPFLRDSEVATAFFDIAGHFDR